MTRRNYLNWEKKDHYGRVLTLLHWSRGTMWRVQIGALYAEWNVLGTLPSGGVESRTHGGVVEFGWDGLWLTEQPKLPPPCEKCGRQVPIPCRDAEGYHTDGPWDYACREIFYPDYYR